jgi:quaternary ammonium compound-resistance protein SugE
MNPWIALTLAGLLEIGWAAGLKYTEGFTKLWPSAITVMFMIASFYCLSLSFKTIPIGTAYAVWTGIGAVGIVLFGIFFHNEPVNLARIICIFMVVAGIIGLKLTAATAAGS